MWQPFKNQAIAPTYGVYILPYSMIIIARTRASSYEQGINEAEIYLKTMYAITDMKQVVPCLKAVYVYITMPNLLRSIKACLRSTVHVLNPIRG